MASTIRLLARAYRACLALAPRDSRDMWADEAADTFRAVCESAYRRGGLTGFFRTVLAEALNLVRAIVSLRWRPQPSVPGLPPNPNIPQGRHFMLSRICRDVRQAARSLVAARTASGVAILILALGIGLNTAVFSVLDAVLWRPVPYPDADRLVNMATLNTARKFYYMGSFSPALIESWRKQTDLFDRVEAYDTPTVVYTANDGAELLPSAVVTPGLFSLLGASAASGRAFMPPDGQDGSDDVVVVSDGFWRSRLKQDPQVIGSVILVDNARCRIVGVMPASFRFPSGETAIWKPYDVSRPPATMSGRTFTPIARIANGLTRAQVTAEAARRGSALASALGANNVSAQVYALSSSFDDKTRQSLWVLGGAVGFLFLVVCANVANLALSRSLLRTRVYAIRSALGASRADLVREALVEHGLVAVVGCAAGIGTALGFVKLEKTVLPDAMTLQAFTPIALDWRAAGLAAALGSFAVLLGLPAAILGSRPSVQALIGAGSRGTTSSAMARRLRASLVVLEICVSTALLVGAALMTRSLLKLESADRGFDTTNLISIRVGLPGATYRAAGQSDRFVADAVRQLRSTPGVTMATLGDLPMNSRPYMLGPVEFSSQPDALSPPLIVPMLAVPPDYFSAMGLRLVSGRTFSPSDGDDAVVVSEGFAKAHWPGGQAIGASFRRESQSWQTVIGVVGDVRPLSVDSWQRGQNVYYQTGHAPEAMSPVSSASSIAEYRTLVVRSSQPTRTVEALPQVIHAVDPQVVVARIALVEHLYADAIARPRTVFLLMSVFAIVGLTLAMTGVYGVLSHLVTQRLREIGIRLALGARPGDVGRAVVGSGIGLGALGLVAGLGLAFALVRVVRALLYDVNPSDPLSFGLVAVVLALTSIAASWMPARRAMRVDPVALLRED